MPVQQSVAGNSLYSGLLRCFATLIPYFVGMLLAEPRNEIGAACWQTMFAD